MASDPSSESDVGNRTSRATTSVIVMGTGWAPGAVTREDGVPVEESPGTPLRVSGLLELRGVVLGHHLGAGVDVRLDALALGGLVGGLDAQRPHLAGELRDGTR